jgi:cephalosporin hydroxylase
MSLLKTLKEGYYGWSADRHLAASVRHLREMEERVADRQNRWRIPFEFRRRGFFKRIRPMQAELEIQGLYERVSKQRPRVVMEIGTCHGGTLYMWCQAASPDATLISLDLPEGEFGGGYRECRAGLYQRFSSPDQTLHLVRADSHDAATVGRIESLLQGRKIDFLFIDGDHTYEGVRRDYELYTPLVAPGGLVALHDVVKREDQARIEVWRFWEELKQAGLRVQEWIETSPGKRSIGIGLVQLPA